MNETVRSFVAVPLPGALQSRIFAAAQELARELPQSGIRWSRKVENLHITVKFLGPVAEERLPEIGAALARAVGGLARFGIEVRGMGAFPSARKATVVWAGVEDATRGLAGVAGAVEATAAALGLGKPEEAGRPFRAHVTVGRCKGGVDARAALARVQARSFGGASVDEVHLYESRLGGGPDNAGSTYVLRSRAALASN